MENVLIDADAFYGKINDLPRRPSTIYYLASSDNKLMRSLLMASRTEKDMKAVWKVNVSREELEDISEVWIGSSREKELTKFAEKRRSVAKVIFKEPLAEDESLDGFIKVSPTVLERDYCFHKIGDYKFKISCVAPYFNPLYSSSHFAARPSILAENICFVTTSSGSKELPCICKNEEDSLNESSKVCFDLDGSMSSDSVDGWSIVNTTKLGSFSKIPKFLKKSYVKMNLNDIFISKTSQNPSDALKFTAIAYIWIDPSVKVQSFSWQKLQDLTNNETLLFLDNCQHSSIDEALERSSAKEEDKLEFKKYILFNEPRAMKDYKMLFSKSMLSSQFFFTLPSSGKGLFSRAWELKCRFPSIDDDIILSTIANLSKSLDLHLVSFSIMFNSLFTSRKG